MPEVECRSTKRSALPLAAIVVATLAIGCASDKTPATPTGPTATARTFRMGFTATPPVYTTESVVATITMWSTRGDAAEMAIGIPWATLLAGTSPEADVRNEDLQLAQFYRAHGLALVINLDVTNGLARDQEAPDLVAAGRSITEPAIQQLYRRFAAAVDTILHPDYLGFATETNLIRFAAPAPVYQAVKQMANDAASDARARGTSAKLLVSVQVESAWGRLGGPPGYVGIGTDLSDFPFMDAVGLSSYPYLGGFTQPEDIPLDYYSRIAQDAGRPVLVLEGGWASQSGMGFTSSPALQARYITRQMQLLDAAHAAAVFQLTFADLELSSFPPPQPDNLPLFITLGLVDTLLQPKPALAVWDSAFARPRSP